jgi:hypothetical protein
MSRMSHCYITRNVILIFVVYVCRERSDLFKLNVMMHYEFFYIHPITPIDQISILYCLFN